LVYNALYMRPSLGLRFNLTKVGLMAFYRFQSVLTSFLQHDGLPFADVLTEATIQQAFDDAGVPTRQNDLPNNTIYTQAVTLWAFLSQVLHQGIQRACAAAVERVIAVCVDLGQPACSDDTGAYCRARARLPLPVIRQLTQQLAAGCEQQVPAAWLWRGLHVHLVDGTTNSTPDTPSLQAEYPQPNCQRAGVGFPLIRMVVILSLPTAMLEDAAMGPYAGKETGETALFRQLLGRIPAGDVVLADCYFCSYFMIALLQEADVHFVGRIHQRRDYDFRRGRRLGPQDHVVTWTRPARPTWMDAATYARMPATLTVREVGVQVNEPGFRVESFVVVTTLLDAVRYTREDIGELYHRRWLVELDIRSIKSSLSMDVLRCKTPEMVRKEIWTCLLAYNLIRQTMLRAALLARGSPRQLSLARAMQKIAAAYEMMVASAAATVVRLIAVHLANLGGALVGDRPNRVEPRRVKRRPKPHRLLTEPRAAARARLLAGAALAE
jgi:putative transposase